MSAPTASPGRSPAARRDRVLRWLLSTVVVVAGVLHFVAPGPFVRIVPGFLPAPLALVYLSGVAEIAGGVGLHLPSLRRAAGVGLIALFVAVFPANVNQAAHHVSFTADGGSDGRLASAPPPAWLLWARLPLQGVLIWAAWRASRRTPVADADEKSPLADANRSSPLAHADRSSPLADADTDTGDGGDGDGDAGARPRRNPG